MNEQINIRPAVELDCPVILDLIQELAAYQGQPEEVEVDLQDLCDAAFGEKPILECLLAEVNGEVVGAALVFEKYSTWKGRSLHLEDLVVREKFRGSGIGSLLFEAVMELSHVRGYGGLNWQVLDSNASAIKFYKKFGAYIAGDWFNGRLSKEDLNNWMNQKK